MKDERSHYGATCALHVWHLVEHMGFWTVIKNPNSDSNSARAKSESPESLFLLLFFIFLFFILNSD